MIANQSISRLSIVLPAVYSEASDGPGAHSDPCQELLVDSIGRAVRVRGVHIERHLIGRTGHGGVRADLAIWLPHPDGQVSEVDRREISADFHGAYVPNLNASLSRLADYDVLFVHHMAMESELKKALEDSSVSDCFIVDNRIPLEPPKGGAAPAQKHGMRPELRVMIDVRQDFELLIERVVFQLALTKCDIIPIFLVPHTSQARQRLRHLCERHQLSGFLASGPHAIADSAWEIDDFIGRPKWAEMLVLAMSKTSVAYWNTERSDADPITRFLIEDRCMSHQSAGILQLAVELERRYEDKGGLIAQGKLLHRTLAGNTKSFLEQAATAFSRPQALRKRQPWEPVGPQSAVAHSQATVVTAREAGDPKQDEGSGVEAALLEMKRRLGLSEDSL